MPTNTVNLDALIPRDDFALLTEVSGENLRSTISLTDLNDGFFSAGLRKPDFQRETTHWTPSKIVDLVKAFLNGDLIPAVILWKRGGETFVIDGAHRLSALMAWIKDDYGDRQTSLVFFGANITEEQKKIAEKTRTLMRKHVGTFSEFQGLKPNLASLSAERQAEVMRLGTNSIVAQWVTATDPKAAEDSFFKINQAAQPIDPTERMILQSRNSPNAIAARCIVRGGKGHRYWASFEQSFQTEIEEVGARIYEALYSPPLQEPIKSLDMPVAGKGYNSLPFAFFLVNLANGVPIPKTGTEKKTGKALPCDADGTQTLAFLRNVEKDISLITTNESGSLGFHPAIYFYGNSGAFLPVAFLAAVEFAKDLHRKDKKKKFTEVRKQVEDYLFENKTFISLTITRLGSGGRSLFRVKELFWRAFDGFSKGLTVDQLTAEFLEDPAFAHFAVTKVPSPRQAEGASPKGRIASSTKSSVYLRDAMTSVVRCCICGAALHSNAISYDHTVRRSDGGSGNSSNVGMAHPFCNSGVKG